MTTECHEHKFTGVFIPAHIWEDTRLSLFERFLWAEISALAGKDECFASNTYLAQKLNVSPTHVSDTVSKLKKMGLLIQTRFDGRTRYLKPTIAQDQEKKDPTEDQQDRFRKNPESDFGKIPNQTSEKSERSNIYDEKQNEKQEEITPYNPPRGGVGAVGDSFDEFWKAYVPVPGTDGSIVNKGDKSKARQKYLQYIKHGEKPEDILNGLRNYLADCMKNRIKSCGANVFLNQERWKREYEQSAFGVNFTELVALWNDMAGRLHLDKVNESDLMPERKAEIQQIIAIKQPKDLKSLMDGLENIIKRTPKLLGVQEELDSDNRWYTRELGWKANFAFCFSTRGWADIMTGKYNGEGR